MKIPFTNIVIGREGSQSDKRGLAYSVPSYGALGSMSGKRISMSDQYELYRSNADIFGCVREWRENTAAGGLLYLDPQNPEEGKVDDKIVVYFKSVLNYYSSFNTLKNDTIRDLAVTGNSYWEIVRNKTGNLVLGVCRLDPRTMTVISNEYGEIKKYIQRSKQGKAVEFSSDDIVHFKLDCDPDNPIFGLSPIETIVWEAKTEQSAKLTNYYFYENRAEPGMWYVLEDGLQTEQVEKAIEQVKNQVRGPQNVSKALIMQGIKEIKTFSISQKDMEYIATRKYATEKICVPYGVPKFLLGYDENTNYSNGRSLFQKFYEGTVAPLESRFTDTINRELIVTMGLVDKLRIECAPMLFNEQSEIEARALNELRDGAITLRQYKKKTGQDITPEDEKQPNFDAYIIHNGASALLLDDVGLDPVFDQNNTEQVNKILETIKNRYSYNEKQQ